MIFIDQRKAKSQAARAEEKMVPQKNFKEVKEDLAAVLEKNEAIRRTQQKEGG